MDKSDLDHAITLLCQRFLWHCDVDILIVGGAAGMLTNQLAKGRTTRDCDVIDCAPDAAWQAISDIAVGIGQELGLPKNWFNSDIMIRLDCLPSDWKDRRTWVAQGPRLSVFAVSRPDLIAMKFLAQNAGY